MTDLQAAIGIHQLERVEPYWKRRETIWKRYNKSIANIAAGLHADPDGHETRLSPMHDPDL